MSLADLCLRQDRLAQARILVEEVLSRDPQHPQALTVLGDLFLKQNSPKKALECFRQALAREPRDYLILRSARALKEMGRFAEALEELDKVLVVKPKSFSFLKEKGLVLNKMKRFDQALEAFEKAKEISPDDSFVHAEILRLCKGCAKGSVHEFRNSPPVASSPAESHFPSPNLLSSPHW